MNRVLLKSQGVSGIEATMHRAFGWLIAKLTAVQGTEFDVEYEGGPRQDDAVRTLWTKGRIEVSSPTEHYPTTFRTPGLYVLDLPDSVAGTMTWKVLEDAEWWCINAEYNKAKLPNLTPLRLQAQEVINFSVGSRLLICHGSVSVNDVIKDPGSTIKIVTEPGLDIRAETDVYALKFDL